ncbi:unnamed protein product [Tilletia laevis]|uniref:Holocytochrome c-type synthase n=3 Tax=Tilletia TaxID=13289 RepID=A0A8X7MVY9_9BASI|nr:hypothetical protein CF336_g1651 [Tilletia laevis]KAE8202532.1 hypothetical protein CF328_g2163 [Tilletia controversa]KAE8261198.1 hypothetical protein A4X03_0g3465 [Tilletia caries]KAE8206874.1 hypothetical protein CF335_g1560 [Tilletia laevis]KAE8251473.1 hypothetical protein A4X06_0g2663 [Tilletia controversa]
MLLDSWHAILAASAPSAAGPSRSFLAGPSGSGRQKLPNDHRFSSLTPPAGCPMHQPDSGAAGSSSIPGGSMARSSPPTSSPGSAIQQPLAKAVAIAAPSLDHPSSNSSKSWSETLNPLNMMPFLSNARASESQQKVLLPTERTVSSIPRSGGSPPPGASPYDKVASGSDASTGPAKCPVGHGSGVADAGPANWEYPSPQQFYNALVRKGWETPEEHVEAMVMIHNWLNEAAWQEVLEWERLAGVDPAKVELARFQGKPGTLSPKARLYNLFGKVMPSTFHADPPFDRHDWIVRRPPTPGSTTAPEEVRYIIDYYSVPEHEQANPDDEPEFVLDIRPALDSVGSAWVRCSKTWDEYVRGRVPGSAAAAQGAGSGVAGAPLEGST